ncbi:MAG: hypothetical protein COB46_03490 [Rhodospirillaceae bacterium]|nr:MAG: hypothetical protein COB46_03490 [Rhodospirillaceae bacterium]
MRVDSHATSIASPGWRKQCPYPAVQCRLHHSLWLYDVVVFGLFFVVLNKAFCGWVCPLGTVQKLMYKVGRHLKLSIRRFTQDNVDAFAPSNGRS